MTIEYKSGITVVVLNRVLEWCYTDTLDFESMELVDIMVLHYFFL